nr:MAG TPA: hypothetical protein [Caudoviricetes sp.]
MRRNCVKNFYLTFVFYICGRFLMLTKNIYQQGSKTPLGTLQMQGVDRPPKSQRKPKI